MILPKIYKRDVAGNIRVWWAETDNVAHWRTHSGTLHGEVVTSEWREAPPRSQSSAAEQAYFEANAAMKKKLKVDYRKSIDKIDEGRNSIIKPMLAGRYAGWGGKCYAQPKLDGMRCLANSSGLWSRNNKRIVSAPHIEAQLESFFKQNPNLILDGELYNHKYHDNFNSIMSMTRKTKPTEEHLELSKKYVELHVYDLYDQDRPSLLFGQRYVEIMSFNFPTSLVKVRTIYVRSEDDLDEEYSETLKAGYEGQIIRFNVPYQQKRNNYLLKRKDWIDEEFPLDNVEEGEGNWKGMAKKCHSHMPNGSKFIATPVGTQEYCIWLLRNWRKYKSMTVKYHRLTPDGVPRFGNAIKFHEEEFEDVGGTVQRDLFA